MKISISNRLLVILAASLAVPCTPLLAAAPGDLDAGFGSGGKVITPIGTALDRANGVIVQSGGKILMAGTSNTGGNYDFALVRCNADGTLDTTLGTNGRVTTSIGTSDYAYGVAIQGDGKIVVAGHANNGTNNDFMVVRYVGITEPEIVVEQPRKEGRGCLSTNLRNKCHRRNVLWPAKFRSMVPGPKRLLSQETR